MSAPEELSPSIDELREAAKAARVAEREAKAAWGASKRAVRRADMALVEAEIEALKAKGWTRPGDMPLVEFDRATHILHAWAMFTADGHEYAWEVYARRDRARIARGAPYTCASLQEAAEHARRLYLDAALKERGETVSEYLAPEITDLTALLDRVVREYVYCDWVPSNTTATWREVEAVERAWGRKLTKRERDRFVRIPRRVQAEMEELRSQEEST